MIGGIKILMKVKRKEKKKMEKVDCYDNLKNWDVMTWSPDPII